MFVHAGLSYRHMSGTVDTQSQQEEVELLSSGRKRRKDLLVTYIKRKEDNATIFYSIYAYDKKGLGS